MSPLPAAPANEGMASIIGAFAARAPFLGRAFASGGPCSQA
ncbi:hypothetical protein [Nocardiopsis alba]|nr:hypothetical protein [Nocardiopsis alba]